jgi:transcriptional regulator with XRE-family HTH domain
VPPDRPDPQTLSRLRTGLLIREARTIAGLTQAELAAAVGTKQPVISRWERELDEPRIGTLARLLRACGLEGDLAFRRVDEVDRAQVRGTMRLSPQERLEQVEQLSELIASARPVRVGA